MAGIVWNQNRTSKKIVFGPNLLYPSLTIKKRKRPTFSYFTLLGGRGWSFLFSKFKWRFIWCTHCILWVTRKNAKGKGFTSVVAYALGCCRRFDHFQILLQIFWRYLKFCERQNAYHSWTDEQTGILRCITKLKLTKNSCTLWGFGVCCCALKVL